LAVPLRDLRSRLETSQELTLPKTVWGKATQLTNTEILQQLTTVTARLDAFVAKSDLPTFAVSAEQLRTNIAVTLGQIAATSLEALDEQPPQFAALEKVLTQFKVELPPLYANAARDLSAMLDALIGRIKGLSMVIYDLPTSLSAIDQLANILCDCYFIAGEKTAPLVTFRDRADQDKSSDIKNCLALGNSMAIRTAYAKHAQLNRLQQFLLKLSPSDKQKLQRFSSSN